MELRINRVRINRSRPVSLINVDLSFSTYFNLSHVLSTRSVAVTCQTVNRRIIQIPQRTRTYKVNHSSLFKVCPHRRKANAKAKMIKEQSEEIKEQTAKHQRKFSLSRSLSLGLNTALAVNIAYLAITPQRDSTNFRLVTDSKGGLLLFACAGR